MLSNISLLDIRPTTSYLSVVAPLLWGPGHRLDVSTHLVAVQATNMTVIRVKSVDGSITSDVSFTACPL